MTDILNQQIVWLQADKTKRTNLTIPKINKKKLKKLSLIIKNHITMHNRIDLSFTFILQPGNFNVFLLYWDSRET